MVRRHILGSIVQSEGSYVESLKRVLQVRLWGPWEREGGPQGHLTGSIRGGGQRSELLWGQRTYKWETLRIPDALVFMGGLRFLK